MFVFPPKHTISRHEVREIGSKVATMHVIIFIHDNGGFAKPGDNDSV